MTPRASFAAPPPHSALLGPLQAVALFLPSRGSRVGGGGRQTSTCAIMRATKCEIACCHLLVQRRQPVQAGKDLRALGNYLSFLGFRKGSQGLGLAGEEGPTIIF